SPYGAILNYYLKEGVPTEPPKTEKKEEKPATVKTDVEEKPKAAGQVVKTPEEKAKPTEEKPTALAEPKKEGQVKITVTDKDGKMVRQFDGPGAAGVNRAAWDLRFDPTAEPTQEQREAMAAGYGFGPRGPLVDPGEYIIKIKAGAKEATQKVIVTEDLRVRISPEDRAARRAAIDQLYALAKTAAKDRRTMQGLKTTLKATRDKWKADADKPDVPKISDDIQKAAEE